MTPSVEYIASAGQRDFDVPFPFISREHVRVSVNGATSPVLEWVAPNRVRIFTPIAGGEYVLLQRETPIDDQFVEFQNGAVLTQEDLNTAIQQLLYKQQELVGLYEGTLRRARVRIGEANGVAITPEDAANQIATMIAADQILAEFRQRIADIDLSAAELTQQAITLANITASNGTLSGLLTDLRADHEALIETVDALSDLENGSGLAAIIQNEIDARVSGDTALAATIALIGAKSGDNSAFVLDLTRVKVSPVESLASRFSAISSKADGNSAAIQEEQQARTSALAAEASSRNSLAATLRGEFNGLVSQEQSARVSADSAEAASRSLLAATLRAESAASIQQEAVARVNADGVFTSLLTLLGAKNAAGTAFILDDNSVQVSGGIALGQRLTGIDAAVGNVNAAVVNEANTRASADGSLAESISVVGTQFNGLSSTVSTISQSLNGVAARWGVQLNVNGHISGIVMNNGGGTSDMTVLVDKFRIINPINGNILQPFVVENGVVKITTLFAGSINADLITVGRLNVSTLIWDGDIVTNKLGNNSVTRMSSTYGSANHDMRNKPQNAWQPLNLTYITGYTYVWNGSEDVLTPQYATAQCALTFTGLVANSAVKLDLTIDHYRTGSNDDQFYARIVRYRYGAEATQVGDTFLIRSRNGYTLTTLPFIDVCPSAGDYTYTVELQRYQNHGSVIDYVNLSGIVGQK